MKLPSQEYFTVAELCERWNAKENHILDLLLNNKLWAVALVSGIATATWSDANGAHKDRPTKPQEFEVRTWFVPGLVFSIFKEGSGQLTWYVQDAKEYVFDPPVSIRKDELLVTAEELERFEKEHSCGPAELAATGPVEASELKRTQRTLAALVIGLAEKYPAYRSGEKPNLNRIADFAQDRLCDEGGRPPRGWSAATFKKAMENALKNSPLPED